MNARCFDCARSRATSRRPLASRLFRLALQCLQRFTNWLQQQQQRGWTLQWQSTEARDVACELLELHPQPPSNLNLSPSLKPSPSPEPYPQLEY
eukprot:2737760-Pleurochrysis_carterae.AAC.4